MWVSEVVARLLVDAGAFALAVSAVGGTADLAPFDVVACAVIFGVMSAAVRPFVPYVTMPVVLVTLLPALLLVNSGVVWGAVVTARALGVGSDVSGVRSIVLVACMIGGARRTAAIVFRSIWRGYEFYAARSQYRKLSLAHLRYKEQLASRRLPAGTCR